jgi:hypothetical protein
MIAIVRWGVLAAIALVAGCFEPTSHECVGGWVCPEKYACATAPSYCGVPDEVAKCESKADWTGCTYADAGGGVCRGSVCTACTTDHEGCATNGWVAMTAGVDVRAVWSARGQGIAAGPTSVVEYDGLAWSAPVPFPALASGALTGVWGVGDGRAFAVASSGEVFARDPAGTWTKVFTAPAALKGIWGADASHVFAVGDQGTVAMFDGTAWSSGTVGAAAPLAAVWGTSDATDVFAVGKCGAIYRRQGTTWSVSRAVSCGAQADLAGVWGADASHVFAVGGLTTGEVDTFDGTTWSTQTLSVNVSNLTGIWGRSATDAIAIDRNGSTLLITGTNAAAWTAPKVAPGVLFQAITGTPPAAGFAGDVFIGAANGTIYRESP